MEKIILVLTVESTRGEVIFNIALLTGQYIKRIIKGHKPQPHHKNSLMNIKCWLYVEKKLD